MRYLHCLFGIWLVFTGAIAAEQMSVEVFVYMPEGEKPSVNFLGKTLTRNLVLELQKQNLFRVYENESGAPLYPPVTFRVRGYFSEKKDGVSFVTEIMDPSEKKIAERRTVADSAQQRGNAIEMHRAAVIEALGECARRQAETPDVSLPRRIQYKPTVGYGRLSPSNDVTGKSVGDNFYWFGLDAGLPLSANFAKQSHFVILASGGYSVSTRNNGNLGWTRAGIGYSIYLSRHTSVTPEIYGGVMTGRADILTTDISLTPASSAAIFILTYSVSFDFRFFDKVAFVFSGSLTTHYEKNLFIASPMIQGGIRFRL